MKSLLPTLSVLALSLRLAFAAEPARIELYAFDAGAPVADAVVRVDGVARGRLDADGALHLDLASGAHTILIERGGSAVWTHRIELGDGESAQLIATLGDAPSTLSESTGDTDPVRAESQAAASGPPGTLAGRIVSSADGAAVVGARVFVAGTPLSVRTDARGEFSLAVPPGTYTLSAVAPDFGARTIEGVAIASSETTTQAIELVPTGVELPEFVVLEPYIQGSLAAFAEERRATSAVSEILGAEQISRQGDSDVAGALKRVTGLTLVDGRYVYVRGLGERYSSVLLNGAQIPSPDPTRRVVPLDLFPTEILEGIGVQKTFSSDMPGEFGGGTIQLRTKTFPDAFFLRLQGTLGYAQGTTFEDGLRYEGGDRDWTGFDDGSRALPGSLAAATSDGTFLRERSPFNPEGATPGEIETFGEDLAGAFDVDRESIAPNSGFAGSIGNSWTLRDDWRLGFLAAVRYAQSWDTGEERRSSYTFSNAGLELKDDVEIDDTTRAIDGSAFLTGGIELGADHRLRYTGTLVRQTEDEAKITEGLDDNQQTRITELEWIENSLRAHQLGGEHRLPLLRGLGFEWLYTTATAERDVPNKRRYRYDLIEDGENQGDYAFSQRSDNLLVNFEGLLDESDSLDVALKLPIPLGESSSLTLSLGASRLERERDASIRRFAFQAPQPGGPVSPEVFLLPSLEQILTDGNIDPQGFRLFEATRATDNYTAEQSLDALFASADLALGDRFRAVAGARREDNFQQVTTFSISSATAEPVVSTLEESDLLPSLSLSWWLDDDSQVRAIYAETLNRPDFRELSPAPYTDPLQDAEALGNPELETASIKNYDLRYEYYFSPTESFSAALFLKDFTSPIELLRIPGVGVLLTLDNALEARNYGVELDLYKTLSFMETWRFGERFGADDWLDWTKFYVSANYSWIESEVTLDPLSGISQTNQSRPLQGQSPYVVNLQAGYKDEVAGREVTVLYNRFGERIAQVGIAGAPDVYEQPANQLDLVWQERLADELKLKVRLRNLLDPTVEFVQGGEPTREFKRGREILFTLEWSPF
ncbi:MAG TPA: TonB-dependent receptor [Xanthomonadales bacterium]|nr:TonB-dependent receptor [Xanthomonadales bacterium]